MKRFTFRLDRVLDVRRSVESEQRRRLGEAQRTDDQRRHAVDDCSAQVVDGIAQVAAAPSDCQTAGMLNNLTLAVDAARAALVAAEKAKEESATLVTNERTRLDAARQARRAMERLREQRHEAWERDAAKEEQQIIDEVALRRFRLAAMQPDGDGEGGGA